jgi:hypothetical protein
MGAVCLSVVPGRYDGVRMPPLSLAKPTLGCGVAAERICCPQAAWPVYPLHAFSLCGGSSESAPAGATGVGFYSFAASLRASNKAGYGL